MIKKKTGKTQGIFYTNYPRKVIFSKMVRFKTAELPRWKSKCIINLGEILWEIVLWVCTKIA